MYQPKIRDDLIKRLYQTAKARGVPMTHLINEIVEIALERFQLKAIEIQETPLDYQASCAKEQKEAVNGKEKL